MVSIKRISSHTSHIEAHWEQVGIPVPADLAADIPVAAAEVAADSPFVAAVVTDLVAGTSGNYSLAVAGSYTSAPKQA